MSLLERGRASTLALHTVEAILHALGATLEARIGWAGTELDRLLDAGHASLAAAVKQRLEAWGWAVRAEVSFNHYGDRGRIDLLAWHPATRTVLVVELKTDLVDVQALLGSMDVRTRIAPLLARRLGWEVAAVVPAIVFLEDRTTRRRLSQYIGLFDRFGLRGQPAITWVRRPTAVSRPTGILWFRSLPTARVARISGQRVRIGRRTERD